MIRGLFWLVVRLPLFLWVLAKWLWCVLTVWHEMKPVKSGTCRKECCGERCARCGYKSGYHVYECALYVSYYP